MKYKKKYLLIVVSIILINNISALPLVDFYNGDNSVLPTINLNSESTPSSGSSGTFNNQNICYLNNTQSFTGSNNFTNALYLDNGLYLKGTDGIGYSALRYNEGTIEINTLESGGVALISSIVYLTYDLNPYIDATGIHLTNPKHYFGDGSGLTNITAYNNSYNQLISNASYLTTYNATYNQLISNASYLTTYNSTYSTYAYNQTIAINPFNQVLNTTSSVNFTNLNSTNAKFSHLNTTILSINNNNFRVGDNFTWSMDPTWSNSYVLSQFQASKPVPAVYKCNDWSLCYYVIQNQDGALIIIGFGGSTDAMINIGDASELWVRGTGDASRKLKVGKLRSTDAGDYSLQNYVVCYLSDGTLGYCNSQPDSSGQCSCQDIGA